MARSLPNSSRSISAKRRIGLMIIVVATIYTIRVAAKAFESTFVNDDFPEALAIKLEVLPVLFPVHMVTGALALVLVPLTYLLRRRPEHRWVGAVTALCVFLAGVTAYPVAWIAPVTIWSGAGFMAQASVWLACLGLALWNIYKRRARRHRYFMLLMAATMSGAVFFRLYLALWAMLGDFRHYRLFYSIDSWLAWMIPLAATIFLLKGTSPWARNHG